MTTTRLARREKVTTQTVRRWIEGGRCRRFERTPGGHYGVRVSVDPGTILYARVSSARQESSLDTQERLLRDRYPDGQVVRDVGSGFNFRRRGFVALLERALRGEAVHVVAATSDRITRSG
ncbi:MAG: recombinase family protein [Paracoccaceae bacterium]|nr:recombinase family protein [Paracoccaceae bacterium]